MNLHSVSKGLSNLKSEHTSKNELAELNSFSRRDLFESMRDKAIVGILPSLLGSTSAIAIENEKETGEHPGESLVSAKELAERLRMVPTFTLVDKSGAPFAVVGEDAKLSTYFFTTYDEAKRILKSAQKSFEKAKSEGIREANTKRAKGKLPALTAEQIDEEFGKSPWNYARISSVTLDFAVTLAIKASGKRTGSYFYVQPAEVSPIETM